MQLQQFASLVFVRSWWVIAFIIACSIIYERGLKETNVHYQQLSEKWRNLQKEKELAINHQKNLRLQIDSQSDPAWIEYTLMNRLGVVPEGHQKIFFYPNRVLTNTSYAASSAE